MGKRVALVERREVVGGVCVNTGTIPSKTFREAVLHLSGYYYQNIYGVNYRVKDDMYIVDRLFEKAELILGSGKKARKVEIDRERKS